MTTDESVPATSCGIASLLSVSLNALDIDEKSFRRITRMTPVRQFYVDDLQRNRGATLALPIRPPAPRFHLDRSFN